MTTPWIEIEERQHLDYPAGSGYREYKCQARFACLVEVLPHQEWVKLKWGFNASALIEEALDRQKLFLEAQYGYRQETGVETPDYRTLALRFINRPEEGLYFTVLGKIHAKGEQEAREVAIAYYKELKSTFPYDYTLVPAQTGEEFLYLSGADLLDGSDGQLHLAQIKRLEVPLSAGKNQPFLQGLWRSGQKTHEQIWRSLALAPHPVLLNILLRCTILYEKERENLLKWAEEIATAQAEDSHQHTLSALQDWNKAYLERRLAPWGRFFYLQFHLASRQELSGDLFRTIGSAITLKSSREPSPGYQVVSPGQADVHTWQDRLQNLDLILPGSNLPVERLSEVADLEEVFAAVRLPYAPPENGFPDVKFMTARDKQDLE